MSYNSFPAEKEREVEEDDDEEEDDDVDLEEESEIPQWMHFLGISIFPVFGASIAQAFHMSALIVIGAYFVWLGLYSSAISEALTLDDSPVVALVLKWSFVAFTISTFFRFYLARQYNHANDVGLLWAAVESEAVLQTTEEKVQVHHSITKPGQKIKAEVQKHQQQIRKEIMGTLIMPSLGCILLFIVCLALKTQGLHVMPVYTNYIVPFMFISWPGAAGMIFVQMSTRVIVLNVHRLRLILEEVEATGTVPCEFFWGHMIKEYLALDRTIVSVLTEASNILVLFLSMMLVFAWLLVLLGMSTFSQDQGISLFCFGAVAFIGLYVIVMLLPLAQVNSKSHSLNDKKPSLLAVVLRCSAMEMPTEQNVKYLKFLQVVQCCPLGSKVPFVGMITTADLMNYARIIAIVVPGVLSYSLSMMHK